ncbi:MAG: S8 family serine peptidase [Myxococcota bacterium]
MRARPVAAASALLAMIVLLWSSDPPNPPATPTLVTGPTVEVGSRPFKPVAPASSVTTSALSDDASQVTFADAYVPGQRLVRLTDPEDLSDLAADYDLDVLRAAGPSGYGLLGGTTEALAAASQDPRVQASGANGRIVGAGSDCGDDPAFESHQWYLDELDPACSVDSSSVVVAVLDTGVAYETITRSGTSYVAAPSLASSAIVSPHDFINDDPHANDDHQHGTHIASVIASDGGALHGVAQGASLMPIKVLDEHNQGHEAALIEGIWHAVQHGADIINMSLSFHQDYVPSLALQEALQAAADAGIVMVAAAGNDGADRITWPAASPEVIAVGAANQRSYGDFSSEGVPSYSNASAAIDLLAPGGDLHDDHDGDGIPDGILAETFATGQPTEMGYWLMAGTSQAAAMVSGAAVPLVEAGYDRREVELLLKEAATGRDVWSGRGSGYLDVDEEVPSVAPDPRSFYVAMLPYLAVDDHGDAVRPKVRITVFTDDGARADNVKVYANIWGNGDETVFCTTDSNGVCTTRGTHVMRDLSTGEFPAVAWAIAVQSLVELHSDEASQTTHRPRAAVTATDAFQDLVGALRAEPATNQAMLAWGWSDHQDPVLGRVGEGYSLVDSGSGLASIPLGLVLTPKTLDDLDTSVETVTLGVSQDEVPVMLASLDGSGLASIPLGITLDRFDLAFLDAVYLNSNGSGLASIPLGFRVQDATGDGALVKLDKPAVMAGTHLGAQLAEGGWRVEGYGAASVLGSSTTLGIEPAPAPHNDGQVGCAAQPPVQFLP